MSSSHANRYTPEFKQRAVQLYESRSPVTYAEVARELGIDAGTLSKWVAQAKCVLQTMNCVFYQSEVSVVTT